MAEKKRGCIKVGTVSHMRRCMSVEIFLHKKTGVFSAEVYGVEIENKDLETLRREIYTKLDEFAGYQWKPIILVESSDHHFGDQDKFRARIDVEFYRIEVATKPTGKGEMCRPILDEHGLADDDYLTQGERMKDYPAYREDVVKRNKQDRASGRDVKGFFNSDRYTRVPYTDAAWKALMLIKERVEMAQQQLRDLLDSEEVSLKLETIGERFKLLPPAEKK